MSRPKLRESKRTWQMEFGDRPYPWSVLVAYRALERAGWKWSARYGWRKMSGDGSFLVDEENKE